MTKSRSFWRWTSHPITLLILTNKTVQYSPKANNAKIQQHKTTLVQLPLITPGQETRCAYSTMLPNPHEAVMTVLNTNKCLQFNTIQH